MPKVWRNEAGRLLVHTPGGIGSPQVFRCGTCPCGCRCACGSIDTPLVITVGSGLVSSTWEFTVVPYGLFCFEPGSSPSQPLGWCSWTNGISRPCEGGDEGVDISFVLFSDGTWTLSVVAYSDAPSSFIPDNAYAGASASGSMGEDCTPIAFSESLEFESLGEGVVGSALVQVSYVP